MRGFGLERLRLLQPIATQDVAWYNFKKAVKTVQEKLEIKSVPTAIAEMAALALEHLNAIEVEHGSE